MRDSVGAGFEQSVPGGPSIGEQEQAVDASHDVEVATKPVFEGSVNPLFKPSPPKAPKEGQRHAEVDADSVGEMLAAAVGLSPLPPQVCTEQNCWNCTMQNPEGMKSKKSAQFKPESEMIGAMNFCIRKRTQTQEEHLRTTLR